MILNSYFCTDLCRVFFPALAAVDFWSSDILRHFSVYGHRELQILFCLSNRSDHNACAHVILFYLFRLFDVKYSDLQKSAKMVKNYPVVSEEYLKAVEKCKRKLRGLIAEKNCAPLMLRLAYVKLTVTSSNYLLLFFIYWFFHFCMIFFVTLPFDCYFYGKYCLRFELICIYL